MVHSPICKNENYGVGGMEEELLNLLQKELGRWGVPICSPALTWQSRHAHSPRAEGKPR